MSDWSVAIVGGTIASVAGSLIFYHIMQHTAPPIPAAPVATNPPKPQAAEDPTTARRTTRTVNPQDQSVGDAKYIVPVGVDVVRFSNCLASSTNHLVEGRDFRVREFSSLVRVIVPLANEGAISESYETCRYKLSER
jgi:hypothetical protein